MKNIAIVGASGLVGEEIINILFEEGLLQECNLRLFVSEKSKGKIVYFYGKTFRYELLCEKALETKFDVVFFSAGDEISKEWAPKFAKNGAIVIDNSNAFRREDTTPLVVPEINKDKILDSKIIANPNCSTIQLVIVLNELRKVSKIKTVVVSTYQSVSGAGKEAVFDLLNGTKNKIEEGIQNNVVAKIGKIDDKGNSSEEDKIIFESKKILEEDFEVIATAVRVPVLYCHSESVYVEFKDDFSFEDVKTILKNSSLTFSDDEIFVPEKCHKSNQTFVCRLRQTGKKSVSFFVIADNLRRGAAFNATEILKSLDIFKK